MADFVFNIAKGAVAEKVRDNASSVGILLLKTAASDSVMKDLATLTALLAGLTTEANFTGYARITGITATLTVDNTADQAQVTVPSQTWADAGGATNNSLVKAIVFLDEGGTDSTRIPLMALDFSATTDGSDLLLTVGAGGIYTAS